MPLIVFTHTRGAMSREAARQVAEDIRDSLIANYVIQRIPQGLRQFTRMKIIEVDRDQYVVDGAEGKPIYDVELVAPVGSIAGEAAERFSRDIIEAILRGEGSGEEVDEAAQRIWSILTEVPDGQWAVGGRPMNRRTILRHIMKWERSVKPNETNALHKEQPELAIP